MEAIIKINMDNAAFAEPLPELQRILLALAAAIENGETRKKLYDVNGNLVGKFSIRE